MDETELTRQEICRKGLEALQRDLGLRGTFEFLWAMGFGKGDYTAERRERLDHLTADEIMAEIRADLQVAEGRARYESHEG